MEIDRDTKIFLRDLLCEIDDNIGMMIENDDEKHRLELGIEAGNKIEKIAKKLELEEVEVKGNIEITESKHPDDLPY